MTFTTKIRRKTVIRGASALAVGVLVAGGLAVQASAGESDGGDMRANAEILDEKCAVPPDFDPAVINTVHDVATQRGVNDKVMLAAFETGWVESHMNNLNCGDRDSLGVFQQRPSAGWGTPEQIMDVTYATNAFLDQAIPNDQEDPSMTAGQLAQSVQRSAFPDRYDQSEGKAREMINTAANS
jgi:hypothetical protein